ncbi:MAG: 30S ribosomal protein S14 [Candidatus Marsarchaeota archaeon]|jgi:ribosomal protein S14|nr:30S ribosomal protein S14 [Candidatus Marsarchaeota archaeon]
MKLPEEQRKKGRGLRKCRVCGTSRGLIRSYDLFICRRCFREVARDVGFEKYQ